MPSASLTHPPESPSGGGSSSGAARTSQQPSRPPLMSRQSSNSSHSSRQAVISPGSAGEHYPLRHPVKARHTKIVLPRNHNSGRNLAKLARQAQNANVYALEDGRKHARQRSHEGDTEIRLPGSLDDSSKPPMRRNMTAYQLPRNTSHVKLKKNLSHGQLTRLSSGRNLVALNTTAQRAPPSPGLKGKSKRPKSADLTGMEQQLQEQVLELPRQKKQQGQQGRKGSEKRVGFAVGSVDDASGEDEIPEMEGSGLQEDEWTEESASASPYSTRQNTANNSRRTSMVSDRNHERLPHLAGKLQEAKASSRRWQGESAQTEGSEDGSNVESESSEPPSPRSTGRNRHSLEEQKLQQVSGTGQAPQDHNENPEQNTREESSQEQSQEQQLQTARHSTQPAAPPRSVSSQHREHQNPTTRRLLDKGQQVPAPALVSNVSALDDMHSNRGSPAPSMRSSRSNIGEGVGDGQEDELVSRFVPSASHPSTGSGANTALNTPKQSGFHTPEEDSTLATQRRDKHASGFQLGPASPGSPMSGSSGATTPAMQRSRTELRMLQEKAMADLETAADQRPPLPAHVYDRRNESLKSYLNTAGLVDGRGGPSMGPDLFQGRFRALNTELRVVQKFRDPLGEAVARLRSCKGSRLNVNQRSKQQTSGLTTSKSAVSLPAAQRPPKGSADLSKSASPPKSSHSLKKGIGGSGAQSSANIQSTHTAERQKGRREVSFARAPPETREFEPADEEMAPDVIARQLWEAV